MKNRSAKARDMARSVLPSTRRRQTRFEKRRVHQHERAHAKEALRLMRVAQHPDEVDVDLEWVDRASRLHLVWERRAADKVSPLVRWAEARVATNSEFSEAPFEDVMVRFARILPPGVIGRHALSHLSWALDSDDGSARYRSAAPATMRAGLRDAVETILRFGGHRHFNCLIKEATPTRVYRQVRIAEPAGEHLAAFGPLPPRHRHVRVEVAVTPRLLEGIHDIDCFVDYSVTKRDLRELTLRYAEELRAPQRC